MWQEVCRLKRHVLFDKNETVLKIPNPLRCSRALKRKSQVGSEKKFLKTT